jgi:imidazole glycerol phosphate synthase subunit HisF
VQSAAGDRHGPTQKKGANYEAAKEQWLITQIADAVSVPVLAAGGIADGRGIAAAFALGAAVQTVLRRFQRITLRVIARRLTSPPLKSAELGDHECPNL